MSLLVTHNVESSLRALKEHPALGAIILPNAGMEDWHVDYMTTHIAFSSTLQVLDLSCNCLTAVGFKKLAAAISVNESLEVVQLWGNPVCPHTRSQVDDAFRTALMQRASSRFWALYEKDNNDIPRLRTQ